MDALEHDGKRAFELFQNAFDKGCEVELSALRIPNVLEEHRDNFSIGLALKLVALLLKHKSQRVVVSDNTVVNDGEFICRIRTERMAVNGRGSAVGCPAGMSDRNLIDKSLLKVNVGFCN